MFKKVCAYACVCVHMRACACVGMCAGVCACMWGGCTCVCRCVHVCMIGKIRAACFILFGKYLLEKLKNKFFIHSSIY